MLGCLHKGDGCLACPGPQPPLVFFAFVFSRPPTAFDPLGRPLNERSITHRPACSSTPSVLNDSASFARPLCDTCDERASVVRWCLARFLLAAGGLLRGFSHFLRLAIGAARGCTRAYNHNVRTHGQRLRASMRTQDTHQSYND